jgi:DnaK suppressor protein
LLARRRELTRLSDDHLASAGARPPSADESDVAQEGETGEVGARLAELEHREVAQIDRAITRIDSGLYGSCEVCENEIPAARLEALPYATVCVRCQTLLEQSPGFRPPARTDDERASRVPVRKPKARPKRKPQSKSRGAVKRKRSAPTAKRG